MAEAKRITRKGVPTLSGLETYMSVTVVTGTSVGTTTDDALTSASPTTGAAVTSVTPTTGAFVNSISTTSVPCEACGEEETFVTSVTGHTATAVTGVSSGTGTFVTGINTENDAFVTEVTLTETTEEILIPIVMTDTAGRAHIVLSGENPAEPEDYTTD